MNNKKYQISFEGTKDFLDKVDKIKGYLQIDYMNRMYELKLRGIEFECLDEEFGFAIDLDKLTKEDIEYLKNRKNVWDSIT
jgi:hypothetical protein